MSPSVGERPTGNIGVELARPGRPKAAHSSVTALRAVGPSKLGPYIRLPETLLHMLPLVEGAGVGRGVAQHVALGRDAQAVEQAVRIVEIGADLVRLEDLAVVGAGRAQRG